MAPKNHQGFQQRAGDDKRVLAHLTTDVAQSYDGLAQILKWKPGRVKAAISELVYSGAVQVHPGRGGRIYLARSQSSPARKAVGSRATGTTKDASLSAFDTEEALYKPLLAVLDEFVRDVISPLGELVIHSNPAQGSRDTNGTWTRPDVAAAGMATFRYLPGKHLEVFTFEIKTRKEVNIRSLYEALGHRRAATRSYVVFHCPGEQKTYRELEAIAAEAGRLGIGVLLISDPSDRGTLVQEVEADRFEPDPLRLNQFISQYFEDKQKNKIESFVR
jgi:hypothetical protein